MLTSLKLFKIRPTECWPIIVFRISIYSEILTLNPRIISTKKGIIKTIIGVSSAITGDEMLYRLKNWRNDDEVFNFARNGVSM